MKQLADGTVVYFPIDTAHTLIAVGWYLELGAPHERGRIGNIMAMVMKDPGEPWRLDLRTRMYVDDLLTDASKDIRQGYTVTSKAPHLPDDAQRDELVTNGQAMFNAMVASGVGALTRVDGHKDTEDFMRIWGTQPWSNMREESAAPGTPRPW